MCVSAGEGARTEGAFADGLEGKENGVDAVLAESE